MRQPDELESTIDPGSSSERIDGLLHYRNETSAWRTRANEGRMSQASSAHGDGSKHRRIDPDS
jgi:hypothetical protein